MAVPTTKSESPSLDPWKKEGRLSLEEAIGLNPGIKLIYDPICPPIGDRLVQGTLYTVIQVFPYISDFVFEKDPRDELTFSPPKDEILISPLILDFPIRRVISGVLFRLTGRYPNGEPIRNSDLRYYEDFKRP